MNSAKIDSLKHVENTSNPYSNSCTFSFIFPIVNTSFRNFYFITITYLSNARITVIQIEAVSVILTKGQTKYGNIMVQMLVERPNVLTKQQSLIKATQKTKSTQVRATIKRLKLLRASFLDMIESQLQYNLIINNI